MWMLDDSPLGDLARLAPQVAHWPAGLLHVAESVADATNHDKSERRQAMLQATVRPDLIFVCQDQRATLVALAELGPGWVASPFDCWDALRQQGLIDDSAFGVLSQYSLRRDGGLPGIPWRFRKA